MAKASFLQQTHGPRHSRHSIASGLAFLVVLLGVLVAPLAARAQIGSDRYSSIVIDGGTGRVLSAMNADDERYPASLTKMMTLYMLFEAVRDHRITFDQLVPVSEHAASMPPTKLGLTPGTRITVEQAVLGLVTKSANDAAAALGELMGGGEERFAEMMTLRARALGMTHTQFRNASGLPDFNQVTTARDMAILARHLIQDFPDQYHYFSTASFVFHGHLIPNHDPMLRTYPGADGLKTGYIDASGHNLVTSALRANVRLIGVVLGAGSNGERDQDMRAQLDDGFERMDVPPIRMAAASAPGMHLPALIPSAEAATLPRAARPVVPARNLVRLADAHTVGPAHPEPTAWAVQIGAFSTEAAARQAAVATQRAEGGTPRIEKGFSNGKPVWRAQLAGLSRADARATCAHHRGACSVLTDQVASR